MLDARVRHHDVEAPERLQRGVDGAPVALAGGEVGGEAGAGQAVGLEVDGEDVEPVGDQPLGDGAADPARGAGDECGAGHQRRSASLASRASHSAPTSSIQRIASPSGAGVSV